MEHAGDLAYFEGLRGPERTPPSAPNSGPGTAASSGRGATSGASGTGGPSAIGAGGSRGDGAGAASGDRKRGDSTAPSFETSAEEATHHTRDRITSAATTVTQQAKAAATGGRASGNSSPEARNIGTTACAGPSGSSDGASGPARDPAPSFEMSSEEATRHTFNTVTSAAKTVGQQTKAAVTGGAATSVTAASGGMGRKAQSFMADAAATAGAATANLTDFARPVVAKAAEAVRSAEHVVEDAARKAAETLKPAAAAAAHRAAEAAETVYRAPPGDLIERATLAVEDGFERAYKAVQRARSSEPEFVEVQALAPPPGARGESLTRHLDAYPSRGDGGSNSSIPSTGTSSESPEAARKHAGAAVSHAAGEVRAALQQGAEAARHTFRPHADQLSGLALTASDSLGGLIRGPRRGDSARMLVSSVGDYLNIGSDVVWQGVKGLGRGLTSHGPAAGHAAAEAARAAAATPEAQRVVETQRQARASVTSAARRLAAQAPELPSIARKTDVAMSADRRVGASGPRVEAKSSTSVAASTGMGGGLDSTWMSQRNELAPKRAVGEERTPAGLKHAGASTGGGSTRAGGAGYVAASTPPSYRYQDDALSEGSQRQSGQGSLPDHEMDVLGNPHTAYVAVIDSHGRGRIDSAPELH